MLRQRDPPGGRCSGGDAGWQRRSPPHRAAGFFLYIYIIFYVCVFLYIYIFFYLFFSPSPPLLGKSKTNPPKPSRVLLRRQLRFAQRVK